MSIIGVRSGTAYAAPFGDVSRVTVAANETPAARRLRIDWTSTPAGPRCRWVASRNDLREQASLPAPAASPRP
jgi:hypothetical protein